jgi:hypothetical protein
MPGRSKRSCPSATWVVAIVHARIPAATVGHPAVHAMPPRLHPVVHPSSSAYRMSPNQGQVPTTLMQKYHPQHGTLVPHPAPHTAVSPSALFVRAYPQSHCLPSAALGCLHSFTCYAQKPASNAAGMLDPAANATVECCSRHRQQRSTHHGVLLPSENADGSSGLAGHNLLRR